MRIICDAVNESERIRLEDWLRQDELRELLEPLFEYVQERAA